MAMMTIEQIKEILVAGQRLTGHYPLKMERYLIVREHLKEWEAKHKRAANKVKLYRRKARRYEKVMGI